MTITPLQLLSFLIALAAFIYGVIVVSRKDGPMYFRIIIGAAVCHLLKELSIGFLKSSRGCNLWALLYYIMLRLQVLVGLAKPQSFSDAMRVAVSVSVMILVLAAERGIKRWKILISSFS